MRELTIKIDCDELTCGNCDKHTRNGVCFALSKRGEPIWLKRDRATKDFWRCKACLEAAKS